MPNRGSELTPASSADNSEQDFNIITDSTETDEALRELSEERGDKVNKTEIAYKKREELLNRRAELQAKYDEITKRRAELQKKREELLKRKTELEAKLRAAGIAIPGEAAPESPVPEPEESEPEESEPSVSELEEADSSAEVSPAQVAQKIKRNLGIKKLLAGIALTAFTTIMTATGLSTGSTAKAAAPAKATTKTEAIVKPSTADAKTSKAKTIEGQIANTDVSGEALNGTTYNYTEYADRDNKISYNAYGYNYKDQFGDRAATTGGILHMAEDEPEALASYAAGIFTDEEKQALGIKGYNMNQIDEALSSGDHGGDLQKKLLEKLKQILEEESTSFKFYYENDTEQTNYIYFIDDNGDGVLTPSELHLGYDTKKRNNAPQVDISRLITLPDGTTMVVKMLDLNMSCGYQPNFEVAPAGVPKVKANNPSAEIQPTIVATPQDTPQGITPQPGPGPNPGPGPGPDPGPGPGPEPGPEPEPEPEPEPGPGPDEEKTPKDPENLERIDEKILDDIADDIGTEQVVVTPTENVEKIEEKTDKPSGADYEGTTPTIVQNEASIPAEEVQPIVSPENDYSQDLGGANAGNATANPVQDNIAGQEIANQNEIPVEQAPTSGTELENALSDLGIS